MTYRHVCERCGFEPSDDHDGLCTYCRTTLDDWEAQREIDDMSSDEYELWKAQQANAAFHAFKMMKVA